MSARDPLIGTRAGNYTLVETIGEGGMGRVYRAVHEEIGSRVAIKVLNAVTGEDSSGAQRFLREAQVVNRIEHDGVVKILDAGRLAKHQPYLVMELLDGDPLSRRIQRAIRLPFREACQIAIDILDITHAAHEAGVVHRDLKPSNIFITRGGRTVVLDFGIAKLLAPDSPARLTMNGCIVGSPLYMAPEQILDTGVGPLVDVYAIGVILYEMLCGRRPFDGESSTLVMRSHIGEPAVPPRSIRPDVPRALQDAVLRALEKQPEQRFPSAAAMRDELRQVLPTLPEASEDAALEAPTRDLGPASNGAAADSAAETPNLRRPREVTPQPEQPSSGGVWWLGAAVAITVAAAAAGVWWFTQRPSRDQPPPSRAAPPIAMTAPAPPLAIPVADASVPIDGAAAPTPADAAEATPPAHRKPPAPGTILVSTDPCCGSVFINGTLVGKVPLELEQRGKVTIKVTLEGYRTERRLTKVIPGKLQTVHFSLKRENAPEQPGNQGDPTALQRPD